MKLDGLTFIVASLACYRATVLISRDLGPFRIFARLRSFDRTSKLLKCPFCVSIYVGAFAALGLACSGISAPWPIWVMLALAFSAVAIIADRIFTADHNPR